VSIKQYIVKFAPWNERTLSGLINETIKFSTVFDFNDFNEFRYLGGCNADESVLQILEGEIEKIDFLLNLKRLSKETLSPKGCEKIDNILKQGKKRELFENDETLSLLKENLAFSSVGIFCAANIKVFEDDSAQLMFAHYAKNLQGIALIYEIEEIAQTYEIIYESEGKCSFGAANRLIEWYQGCYREMYDFICKSLKWEYEKEIRMFNKPGVKACDECKIKLKSVLYTPRFSGEEAALFKLNKEIYGGKLVIEEIYTSNSHHYFMMENGDKITDFLGKSLK
jgi:hypothetical protein